MYMDDLKLSPKSKNELKKLINTSRMFSQEIEMEFVMENCAILGMKKRKLEISEGKEMATKNK